MTIHTPVLSGIPYKQSSVHLHASQDTLREAATTLEAVLTSLSLTEAGKGDYRPQNRPYKRNQERTTMPDLVNLMDIAATICELEVSMQIEANHSSIHQQDWEKAIAHLQSAETIVLHLLAAKSQKISGSTPQKTRFRLLRGGLGEEVQTSPGDVPY